MRPPTLATAVGSLLRLWRQQACMTQDQVAGAMGSHRPIIGRLENGTRLPNLHTVVRYSRATGGDVRQMLALVDNWHGFKGPDPEVSRPTGQAEGINCDTGGPHG